MAQGPSTGCPLGKKEISGERWPAMWAFQGALESTPQRVFSSLSFPATPQCEAHQLVLAPGKKAFLIPSPPLFPPTSTLVKAEIVRIKLGALGLEHCQAKCQCVLEQNGPGKKHLLETKFKIVINVRN